MTAHFHKELRLLRTAWMAALGLAAFPFIAWLLQDQPTGGIWESRSTWTIFLYVGGVLLGTELFGREFSHGTFQMLLAAPVCRRRIWQMKWTALAWTVATVQALELTLFAMYSGAGSGLSTSNSVAEFLWSSAILLCATGTGVYWSLLTRQSGGAFWLALATPGIIVLFVSALFSWAGLGLGEEWAWWLTLPAVGLLTHFGAYRLLIRAQDLGLGQVDLLEWLKRPKPAGLSLIPKRHSPLLALARKELTLHQFNLILVAAFSLVFFTGIAAIQITNFDHSESRRLREYLEGFWFLLWPCVPVVIGATAYAEERRMGLDAWQSVLPISIHRQWAVKWAITLAVSFLLGVALPLSLELAVPQFYLAPVNQEGLWTLLIIRGLCWLVGTSVGLYASSLSRTLVQAISAAIGVGIGGGLVFALGESVARRALLMLQSEVYGSELEPLILWTMLLAALPLLTGLSRLNYRGFRLRPEYWRTNVSALGLWLLLVLVVPTIVVDRSWERLRPEPPPARPLAAREGVHPGFASSGGILSVALAPDGALWGWWLSHQALSQPGVIRVPASPGVVRLHPDADWTCVAGNREAIYTIKTDGTLWTIRPRSAPRSDGSSAPSDSRAPTGEPALVRWDVGEGWKALADGERYMAALKRDGSLWIWGRNVMIDTVNGPVVAPETPVQVGDRAGYQSVAANGQRIFVTDDNGQVWAYETPFVRYGSARQQTLAPEKAVKLAGEQPVPPLRPKQLQPVGGGFRFSRVGCTALLSYGIQPDGTVRYLGNGAILDREAWRSALLDNRQGVIITVNGELQRLAAPIPYQLTPGSISMGSRRKRLSRRQDWLTVAELSIPGYPGALCGMTADGVLWQWNRWEWSRGYHHLGFPGVVRNDCLRPFATMAAQ